MTPFIIPVLDSVAPRLISPSEAIERKVNGILGHRASADFQIWGSPGGSLKIVHPLGDAVVQSFARHQEIAESLLQHLKDGLLRSYVVVADTGRLFRLPRDYWRLSDTDALQQPMAPMEWAAGYQPSMEGMPVLLSASEVEEWSFSTECLPISEGGDGKAEAEQQAPKFNRGSRWDDHAAWYLERIRTAPEGGYSRDEEERARLEAGIGRDRMRDLRRELAPKDWSKPGRKKSGG